MDLEQMLRPRSVAIVGASQDPQKFGYKYLAALQHQGFAGRLYAVNPRAEPVLGCKGYQSLSEIPESVDYVISTVPSAAALQVVSESVEKGVRFLHFFTAQFGETGDDAKIGLERELLGLARKGGLRILGPNCMGVYHPDAGLAFWRMPREPGGVGLISQSGGLAGELVRNLSLRGVRFSKVVSFGNALDIDEIELLEFLADDPDTTIIAAYLEGTRDGSALLGALQKAATRKPVLIQKCGRTEAGAQAVASHTASLAGSHAVWEAAAKQSGVCLVGNSEELEDLVVAFSFCRPTSGVGTGVVGAGGGRSVESADCCIESGLTLPALPASLINQLRDHSSTLANWIRNPVDGSILIGSGMTEPEILKIMAQSPEFDFLIANVAEFWSMDESDSLSMLNDTVDGFLSVARDTEKPIAFVVGDTVGEEDWQSQALTQIRGKITEAQRPQFAKIHRATKALARLSRYYAALGERGPRMQSKHGRT